MENIAPKKKPADNPENDGTSKETDAIRQIVELLSVLGRWVTPAFWTLLVVAGLTALVLAFLAGRHLTFGYADLNLANTANMAQAISGTVGTLLSALASLLLIMTLLVQIKEYQLTRRELMNSVRVQKEIERTQKAQLAPLLEQAVVGRQALEMDLITRLLLDLQTDLRAFSCSYNGKCRSCGDELGQLVGKFYNSNGLADIRAGGEAAHRSNPTAQYILSVLGRATKLLNRAELLQSYIEHTDLPGPINQVKLEQLHELIETEYHPLGDQLRGLAGDLRKLPTGTLAGDKLSTEGAKLALGLAEKIKTLTSRPASEQKQ